MHSLNTKTNTAAPALDDIQVNTGVVNMLIQQEQSRELKRNAASRSVSPVIRHAQGKTYYSSLKNVVK